VVFDINTKFLLTGKRINILVNRLSNRKVIEAQRMESLREVWRVARDRKLDEMAKDKKHKKKSDKIDKLKYMPDSYREDCIKDLYSLARLTFRMSSIQQILAHSQEMGAIAKGDGLKT
jgi:hypothetical protein